MYEEAQAVKRQRARRAGRQLVREAADGYSTSGAINRTPREDVPETPLDFAASPEVVRVVVEGERLTYGHLFNPTFATEISRIVPLPHQRLAVYDSLLPQHRLRFLLADDAGAGKTIMTGLYLREMLSRRLISRVLIVCPAGLIGNWERELRQLFNLQATIIEGADARGVDNPFLGEQSNLLIVSVDTLSGERMFERLQEPGVIPYDLAVFDEAHKLAADREADLHIRKTDRYRLAESLAGIPSDEPRWSLNWHCYHLLLLTATPHMGKDFPYYYLWRLLEPDALATVEAFNDYPPDARRQHFLRRTKEEMIDFQGKPIYPQRTSDTLSYDLSQGAVSEQALYDATTDYIQTYYNRAETLNRSAARLAMSVFQRRLASSTYALLRSFERRQRKLEDYIAALNSGKLSLDSLKARQQKLAASVKDIFATETADEEQSVDGQEQNEVAEEQTLDGVLANSLADLEIELARVEELLALARQVYEQQQESKFEKLREVLSKPEYSQEKLIIFTEHRDTLNFLVHRLEGIGYADKIAQIHGGMGYQEREAQTTFFRKPVSENGALYLVATDAAGEGINLQVCRLMVNYDIPWNPARLEQRMGRIHRFGQKYDVFIFNLIAGETREGRVMQTLLEKLEAIRRELGSDKVFDVVGELFKNVSLYEYMTNLSNGNKEQRALQDVHGTLTKEQVEALQKQQERIYGDGGSVKLSLPHLQEKMDQELFRRLLPGYVRRFLEKAAPLVNIDIEGDLSTRFSLRPHVMGSLDWLLPLLEQYPPEVRDICTIYPTANRDETLFLHPGEPVFDRFRAYVCQHFEQDALRGAVFIDPTSQSPYFFHLVQVVVRREADITIRSLRRSELLETRLVGLRQDEYGNVETCSPEQLLLLRSSADLPPSAITFAATADRARTQAHTFVHDYIATSMIQQLRQNLTHDMAERLTFVNRSFGYQESELTERRRLLREKANQGDSNAKSELTKVKQQQNALNYRHNEAVAAIEREPQLIAAGPITFLAHALVVPSNDPQDAMRYDADVEAKAVQVARAYEEEHFGATVHDVSTPLGALRVGLEEWPGFDLLSERPSGEKIAIEVKGRATLGDVELSENEFVKACNLRDRYWLYVVFNCAYTTPMLRRVQDPFGKLIYHEKKRVIIDEMDIIHAAENE